VVNGKTVLTIAGSDPSSGAGLQADIRTITSLGGYALAVVSALTAQNYNAVFGISPVASGFVASQIDAVLAEFCVDVVKTGMLGDAAVVNTVAERLAFYDIKTVVVDPVLTATTGAELLSAEGLCSLKERLLKIAFVTTPNIPEAEALAEMKITSPAQAKEALRRIHRLGVQNVVLTGGHWADDSALDILYDGQNFTEFPALRLPVRNTHGTGCAFSSVLAYRLACGDAVKEATGKAKVFVRRLLAKRDKTGLG